MAAGAVVGNRAAQVVVDRIDVEGKAPAPLTDAENKNPKFTMDGLEEMSIGVPKLFRLSMMLPKIHTHVKVGA